VHAESRVSWIARLIRHGRLPNLAEIDFSFLYVLITAQREGLRTLPLRSDELPQAVTFLLASRTPRTVMSAPIPTILSDVLRGFLQYKERKNK
jgi:hypothetical protein